MVSRQNLHEREKRKYQKRKLVDLNLLDDFLFWSMVSYPNIGVPFVREILRIIFRRDFGELKITAQKTYYGSDTDGHGTRLDVYMEEEDMRALAQPGSIFDLEPNLKRDKQSVAELPRRVRFYHSVIDIEALRSGTGYQNLKNVLIIVITPFDPFDRDRMVYTIGNRCLEEPDMPYDDGMMTLFLNTKGTREIPFPELGQLLHYMEETTPENAVTPGLQAIQQMVDIVKQDKEVSLRYMKSWEIKEMWIEVGREEERENTERERLRAEKAEAEIQQAQKIAENANRELLRLQEENARLKAGA